MFQAQRGEASVFRGARRVVERRITFKEGDDWHVVVEGQQFAETPDATAVARVMRNSARLPAFAEIWDGFQNLERDFDFQRAAAT